MPEQRRLNEQLLRLAPEAGLPLVVTNDLHYVREDQSEAHDVLLCVGHRQQPRHAEPDEVRDARLLREVGGPDGGALPGPARGDREHAPDRRDDRPARCRSASCASRTSRSRTATPSETWLRAECQRGLERRYGTVTPELQARLDYELGVILSMGYAGYFLIVADFIAFAREQGIQTTCRGSAPGSIVTYTLGITPVDPILYQLPFERFLNPDRVTMPDIDVDFEDGRRDEVIAYVGRKYGQDHVAQIITFGTMLARAAIRDVGRVLGHSLRRGRPHRQGRPEPARHPARRGDRDVARAARAWSRATRRSSASPTSRATSRASPATRRPTRPASSSAASR